jgi:DNA-directed RNA polymerase sigma subunit (sigma70/sigma32)
MIVKDQKEDYVISCLKQLPAEQIYKILKTLTPTEERVILLRYFWNKTYEEIGSVIINLNKTKKDAQGIPIFGISKERVRQNCAKAIHKLKHPTRLNALKRLLDGEESNG